MNSCVAGLTALALTLANNSTRAGEDEVAPPRGLTALVKQRLPVNWTCETEGKSLVVRPQKEFVFVNLVSAESQRSYETLDEYHRRHIVTINYRIVLRFVPKLTADQVRKVVDSNGAIRLSLRAIEKDPLAQPDKGRFKFGDTTKGRGLAREYERLKRSVQPVPYGHRGSVTVYIEPTYLGYARFLQEADRAECDGVLKELGTLFVRYDANGGARRNVR
ncbi:MAG TPA: hypothetical protein VFG04_06610 [Planctomycetaceae bacterium]|jgi:hypothetical protein|nr:hypothetical protein [Planctomycetaceae bacterium]